MQNISVINLLIYSVGIGFIAAIIYTNIQRSSLSSFINALITNNCFSDETSMTLSDLGLKGIYASIAKSAVNHQYGLKKSVVTISCDKNSSNDDSKEIIEQRNNEKYFLSNECDIDLLRKRYDYKPLSTKHIVLLIGLLVVVVILTSFLANLLIKNILTPKSRSFVDNEIISENSDFDYDNNKFSDQYSAESNTESTIADNNSSEEVYTPRVPVS